MINVDLMFLNHIVDTELMEMCGEKLAERLRDTMPSKVLTVESTALIPGLPTARKLGITIKPNAFSYSFHPSRRFVDSSSQILAWIAQVKSSGQQSFRHNT